MRILAFAASFRTASLNRKLIELAARIAQRAGAEVDLAAFGEFDMPLFDGDLEQKSGLPPGARQLTRRIESAAAMMMAVPEYNYSVPGPLKNAIDWVSRSRPMPWKGRSIYLLSASPSPAGGVRGLWQTRIPLEGCGALVFPEMFALPYAHQAFGEDGGLRDGALAERLEREIVGFVRLAEAVEPLCCGSVEGREKLRQQAITAALEEETELQPEG